MIYWLPLQHKNLNHMSILFLGNLGATEIILILAVVLLMFGGKKIPELMRGLGNGIREFNDAKSNVKNEIEKGMKEKPSDSEGK
jgi:sec-independent protein translocase protein TatA